MSCLPSHPRRTKATRQDFRPLRVSLVLLSIALLWELSGLDIRFAEVFGDLHGFAWREHWLLTWVFHEGGRRLSWLLALVLCVGVWWPRGVLQRLDRSQRLQLAVTTLAAALAVAVLKAGNATSCPWDLQTFGGVAEHLPHWLAWGVTDGGAGHCFPAGHASSGFAFVGGAFVFRDWPDVAGRWGISALGAGLLFGLAQQVRGAHFMSHTLWAAWICWMVAWGVDRAWPQARAKVSA